MNALERRLRDAFRAAGDTIDPATVPSPPMSPDRRGSIFRRMRTLTPFAAAAAVVAVVASVTLAGGGAASGHHGRPAPHHPAVAAASLPAFTLVNLGSSLQVYDTKTGAAVAELKPPAGQQFDNVASSGTAGTFLATAGLSNSNCHAFFYRFHLSATGQPSSLTLLRSVPDSQPTAVVGIQGGSTYAYSTVHCVTAPPNGAVGISGPGINHTWNYPSGDDYAVSLAATADGRTLALSFYVYGPGFADMLLNTQSSSTSAADASRVLSSVPVSPTLAISLDGKTLYACSSNGTTGTLAGYSTATGDQTQLLHQWPVTESGGGAPGTNSGYDSRGFACLISTDASGRYLLAAVSLDNASNYADKHWTMTGFDLQTGASATVPISLPHGFGGAQLAG